MPPSDDSDLMRALIEAAEAKEAKAFDEAKAKARALGKEPFDLARIDSDWPFNPDNRALSEGVVFTTEERLAQWEPIYYVQHPTIMTMDAFIVEMKRIQRLGAFD